MRTLFIVVGFVLGSLLAVEYGQALNAQYQAVSHGRHANIAAAIDAATR